MNAARPRARRRLAGTGEDDVEIGDAAVRDPGLLAVDDIAVAIPAGRSRDVGDVEPDAASDSTKAMA